MVLFRTDLILFDELLTQYIFMSSALSRVEEFYKNRRDAILSAADKAAFSQSIVIIMIQALHCTKSMVIYKYNIFVSTYLLNSLMQKGTYTLCRYFMLLCICFSTICVLFLHTIYIELFWTLTCLSLKNCRCLNLCLKKTHSQVWRLWLFLNGGRVFTILIGLKSQLHFFKSDWWLSFVSDQWATACCMSSTWPAIASTGFPWAGCFSG